MSIDNLILDKAVLHALFWWQNNEYNFVQSFKRARLNYSRNSKPDQAFIDLFHEFSTSYGVRRCLNAGENAEINYIKRCFGKNGLIACLKTIKQPENIGRIIDEFIESITDLTHDASARSLVSKTAFICYPSKVPLYDAYVVKALNSVSSEKVNSYRDYISNFYKFSNSAKTEISSKRKLPKEFKEIIELSTLVDDEDLFQLRVTDKYLWLIGLDHKNKTQ